MTHNPAASIRALALVGMLALSPAARAEALAWYPFDWTGSHSSTVQLHSFLDHPEITATDVANSGMVLESTSTGSRYNTLAIKSSSSLDNFFGFTLTAEAGKLITLRRVEFTFTTIGSSLGADPFRVDIVDPATSTVLLSHPIASAVSGQRHSVDTSAVAPTGALLVRIHARIGTGKFDDVLARGVVTPQPLDVFIVAGQSNMSGRVQTGYSVDPRDRHILYYYRTDGPSATDQTSLGTFFRLSPLPTGYYGPEISFARALVDKGYNPAIIKISDGGTSLWDPWNSRNAAGVPGVEGRMWLEWKAGVSEALAELAASGHTIRLRGFCWHQGESDQNPAERADSYQANLENLLTDMAAHITSLGYDVSSFRRVSALIRGNDVLTGGAGKVRQAKRNVFSSFAALGHWFDTNDLVTTDGTHLNEPSVGTLGLRFADPFPALAPCPGDWLSDNTVAARDAAVLLSRLGSTVPAGTLGDMDGSGQVTLADLSAWLGLFGSTCP